MAGGPRARAKLTSSKVLQSIRVDGGERAVVHGHLEDSAEVARATISI